jgi:hypothetical protein
MSSTGLGNIRNWLQFPECVQEMVMVRPELRATCDVGASGGVVMDPADD